jgi:hypothetical protein
MGHSELGISEAFLSHEGIELFPDLVLDVDVRVSLVALDVQPGDIPVLDNDRFELVLIMEEKALDTMEQVDDFLVLLPLGHRVVATLGHLRRPVLELEQLAAGEEADNAVPVPLVEGVDRVVDFKGELVALFLVADSVREDLLGFIFLLVRLLHVFGSLIAAIIEELDNVLQADIAGRV